MVYQVNLVSQKNSVFLILGLIALFFLALFLLLPLLLNNEILIYAAATMIAILGYFMWQKFVRGVTSWKVDESGVSITWLKKFVAEKCDDVNLNWSQIESVNEEFIRHYYQLTIYTVKGEELKYYISRATSRSDFDSLLKEINERLSK
jgi:hypothetical protein